MELVFGLVFLSGLQVDGPIKGFRVVLGPRAKLLQTQKDRRPLKLI